MIRSGEGRGGGRPGRGRERAEEGGRGGGRPVLQRPGPPGRAPPRAGGRGPGSAAARGPRKPTPVRPRWGLSPASPGTAPAAHVRAFKLFLEGPACPPRRKMPTEAAVGGGEEAASAFQTSQEFRTLRPNPGCPCG